MRTLAGHQAAINALAFAPLGRLLAAGADKLIKLWDASTGAEVSSLEGHSAEGNFLAFSKDGRMLASSSADFTWPLWPGQIKLWNGGRNSRHHVWRTSVASINSPSSPTATDLCRPAPISTSILGHCPS